MARMTLDDLIAQLRAAYGGALRSIVLYGSAAAGEHYSKHSDYNVLVLLDALDAEKLAAASAASRAWVDAGNPAPLTMTMSEWKGSSDIFPMEYADILDRHRVLLGEAPFEGISVEPAHLRWQLEQEAMGKLIKLRQGLLAAGNDTQRYLELLAGSASAIMIILRAFVRLHNEHPPQDNEALVRMAAASAGFDSDPFVRVVHHVRGDAMIAREDAASVLKGYLLGMQSLVRHLDTFHARPSA